MVAINHVMYSWSMIELTTNLKGEAAASGQDSALLHECTAIDWNVKRKVENLYGLGGRPQGRGFGNVEYTASIEIPFSTQTMLRQMSSDKTLMGLGEFNIVVSWVNDLAQSVTSETVTLEACFFNEEGMSAKQDDANITKQFDLNPYRIYSDSSSNTGKGEGNNTLKPDTNPGEDTE